MCDIAIVFPPTIPMWEAYSSTTGSAPCLSYWSLELWELLIKSYEMRTLSSLTIRVLEICKDFEYDRRHFIVEKEPSKTFSRFKLFYVSCYRDPYTHFKNYKSWIYFTACFEVVKTDVQLTIKIDGKNIYIICLFYLKRHYCYEWVYLFCFFYFFDLILHFFAVVHNF